MRYENPSLCAACGGACCKEAPCFFMPNDFSDLSVEGLVREFKKKDYLCIICSTVPVISIRAEKWPRVVNAFYTSATNPCMILTSSGCPFSYDERPTGAKLLVPDVSDCKSLLTREEITLAWAPYKMTLLQVAAAII